MNLSYILLLLLIGLLAGIVSGTMGVGGGIIIVPALVFVMGFTQHQAQGTSIAMMLPPVVILAAVNYFKNGYVNISAAVILMIAFIAGAYIGSEFAIHLPAQKLKKIFGILMLIAAAKMIFDK